MRLFAIVVAALISVVSAETFTVLVGENGGLTYNPESVVAKVGDVVAFRFLAKNHTVTQSTFAKPCEAMITPTAGIDSGFLPVPAGATQFPEWSFTIDNDTTPFWFYCAQAPHCAKGMVFAVNPTAEKTYAAFKAAALATTATNTTGSGSPSGSNPTQTSGTTAGTGADSSPSASTTNGARTMTGKTAGVLAVVGLVAGLVL
ncbi:hypothetical protein Hypma_000970 [Hypsizygus marmoreus]|uniref:Phytocyanin domain-containing protein n=1 Tax=Hypsizygus marmoreus TaxID=39966 RepID=A0A369J7R3_HYPMA|nr:hypothetical protein Hypma_000970 [Hypsizygus marmoreus]